MTTQRTRGNSPVSARARLGGRQKKALEQAQLGRSCQDEFKSGQPVISATDCGAGTLLPAEAVAGAEIAFKTKHGDYEQHLAIVESTGTAVYAFPSVSADGLELSLDANVTDGVTAQEITNGITAASPCAYTVGTDRPFYLEAKVKIDDISDLEELFVGFRKAEAYQADPDSYDEMAAFHIGETGATAADGQINMATILNNAATAYTDSTEADWADGETKTLKVSVRRSGEVEFSLDGAAPTVSAYYKFDEGEVVVPFLYADNTSGSTTGDPGVTLVSWKCNQI